MADPLARAIEELYRSPQSAFTRERNAKATSLRKAGQPAQAQAILQLRRPSAPLWATNQLAHEDPKRLAEFLDSVERVRQTQLRDPRAAGEALQRQRAELEALVARGRFARSSRLSRHVGDSSSDLRYAPRRRSSARDG
jgi:hypothetical protein